MRSCARCGGVIDPRKRADARYCTGTCRRRAWVERPFDDALDQYSAAWNELRQLRKSAQRDQHLDEAAVDAALTTVYELRDRLEEIAVLVPGAPRDACLNCGAWLWRRGQKYCSSACRVSGFRARRRHQQERERLRREQEHARYWAQYRRTGELPPGPPPDR
jgi:ferredoxin